MGIAGLWQPPGSPDLTRPGSRPAAAGSVAPIAALCVTTAIGPAPDPASAAGSARHPMGVWTGRPLQRGDPQPCRSARPAAGRLSDGRILQAGLGAAEQTARLA